MTGYVVRRLFGGVVVLWGVATLVFLMVRVLPGDPVRIMLDVRATPERIALLTEQLGFDQPLHIQYFAFLSGAIRGDLGRSFHSNVPVSREIHARVWPTVQLALCGIAAAAFLGVLGGVIAAANHNTWIDSLAMFLSTLGLSLPNFLVGMLLMLLFSLHLGWLPAVGYGRAINLVLPSISLGLLYAAVCARMTRSSMLEVVRMEYVLVARAKGLKEHRVLLRHAFRNAVIPVITVMGLYLGVLLGGAVVVETLFAWPGLGRLAVNSVLTRDFPLTQGIVLYMSAAFVVLNLLIDLVYGFLDPRIRYA